MAPRKKHHENDTNFLKNVIAGAGAIPFPTNPEHPAELKHMNTHLPREGDRLIRLPALRIHTSKFNPSVDIDRNSHSESRLTNSSIRIPPRNKRPISPSVLEERESERERGRERERDRESESERERERETQRCVRRKTRHFAICINKFGAADRNFLTPASFVFGRCKFKGYRKRAHDKRIVLLRKRAGA